MVSDAIIAKGSEEVLLSDTLISSLKIELLDPRDGIWRFRDDPRDFLRRESPDEFDLFSEGIVATRFAEPFVAELRKIEEFEQSDRSTVLRKVLYGAVTSWKKEHVARGYTEGKVTPENAAKEGGIQNFFRKMYTPGIQN